MGGGVGGSACIGRFRRERNGTEREEYEGDGEDGVGGGGHAVKVELRRGRDKKGDVASLLRRKFHKKIRKLGSRRCTRTQEGRAGG